MHQHAGHRLQPPMRYRLTNASVLSNVRCLTFMAVRRQGTSACEAACENIDIMAQDMKHQLTPSPLHHQRNFLFLGRSTQWDFGSYFPVTAVFCKKQALRALLVVPNHVWHQRSPQARCMLHDAPDNCRAVLDITVRALRPYLLCQGLCMPIGSGLISWRVLHSYLGDF